MKCFLQQVKLTGKASGETHQKSKEGDGSVVEFDTWQRERFWITEQLEYIVQLDSSVEVMRKWWV